MARFRRRGRRGFRGFKRSRGRGRGIGNPLNVVIPAAIYGAGRGYLSNLLNPITSKVPLGSFADEAVFGVLGYFMAKKGRGIIKNIGVAMLTVEAASVGSQIVGGAIGSSSGTQTSSQGAYNW